jgi:ribosomal protein L37E
MAKGSGTKERVKCRECGGAMYVLRRTPHLARPDHERQTVECTECGYSTKRTVDAAGRPLR